jgi:hypothetical protein
VREKTVSDEDVEARAIRNEYRNAQPEPEPYTRNHGSYRRDAEAEPINRINSREAAPGKVRGPRIFSSDEQEEKRTAEAEPINRINPGFRGNTKRSAKAEPINRGANSRRDPEATHSS